MIDLLDSFGARQEFPHLGNPGMGAKRWANWQRRRW